MPLLVLCGEPRLVKVDDIVLIRSGWKLCSVVSVHFTTSGSLLFSGNYVLIFKLYGFRRYLTVMEEGDGGMRMGGAGGKEKGL